MCDNNLEHQISNERDNIRFDVLDNIFKNRLPKVLIKIIYSYYDMKCKGCKNMTILCKNCENYYCINYSCKECDCYCLVCKIYKGERAYNSNVYDINGDLTHYDNIIKYLMPDALCSHIPTCSYSFCRICYRDVYCYKCFNTINNKPFSDCITWKD